MNSIIITAFKEPGTIGKAVAALGSQKKKEDELIVIAPDLETLEAAGKLKKNISNLRLIQDPGKGKSAALNIAVAQARGDLLVLSDGDVYIGKQALAALLAPLAHAQVGAVSGHPFSTNHTTKYGFWAQVLTGVADELRKEAEKKQLPFQCTGYLFAIRKTLFPKLDEELLSEDGFIALQVHEQGYRIAYAPKAAVYVKYPDNWKDWIKQKRRSAGGYNQLKMMHGKTLRSFGWESRGGFRLLKYVKSVREAGWLASLFLARVYLWLIIYKDINVKKKTQKELWQRVESTK